MKIPGMAVARWCAPILATFAACGVVLALPLFLGFDPVDAADFADAPGLSKIGAFMNGWRHKEQAKHGLHEVEFDVGGEIFRVTFSGDGEPVTGANEFLEEVESRLKEPDEEAQSKTGIMSEEDAQRILAEWGLAK